MRGAVICNHTPAGGVANFDDRAVQVRVGEDFRRPSPCIIRTKMVKVRSATITRGEVSRGEVACPRVPVIVFQGSQLVDDVLLFGAPLSFVPDTGLGEGVEDAGPLGG